MTIMSVEINDDSSDVDIVLEEVSKIFRCRDCLRCYLSYTRFAEHFPVYHPDKLTALRDDQSCKNKTTPTAAHQNFNHEHTFSRRENQERGNISLERQRLNVNLGNSSNIYSVNFQRDETGGNFLLDSSGEAAYPVAPISGQDNENGKGEKYFAKRSKITKTHEANGLRGIGQEVNYGSTESGDSREREEVEVITLSDSDDADVNENATLDSSHHAASQTHGLIGIKQDFESDQETNNIESAGRQGQGEKTINDVGVAISAASEEEPLSFRPIQKKYSCQYCNQLFIRDSALNCHVKRMHQAEIQFENLHALLQQKNQAAYKSDKGRSNKELRDKNKSVNLQSGSNKKGNKVVKNGSKKRSGRTQKRAVKKKVGKTVSVSDDEIPENAAATNTVLAFSCKWCPEKFPLLEDLKKHAINVHIKYKTLN